ncbi:cysteine--tRNA ligase [Phycisphaerae bacterium]|nr:cysteine--tRNA ligase [Phycisphaerae bacterium]
MPLRLFNTISRGIEAFTAIDPARVTFYSCGPTVYDDAHIGNFRSFLAADVLRRFVESPLCEIRSDAGVHRGPRAVTHVMNITDVGHMTDDAEGGESGEDRMAVAGRRIAEAKKAGKLPANVDVNPGDPYQIARFYEGRFREDAKKLGLKLAMEADRDETLMPKATANIAGMIAIVQRLIEKGHAYVVGPAGSRVVYFRVMSFPAYGELSGNTLDELRAGEGGRVSEANQAQKEHPADFLLWKEDATHIMKWESPWGAGYPGWHIECTVMAVGRLATRSGQSPITTVGLREFAAGEPIIDLHSGGEDNIFPHHECEIAQSCCAFSGAKGSFAKHWFHPRFLLVEGTKMSKSKGNFFTARDLFAKGIEASTLRLELIRTHYRSNANFTMQGLMDCAKIVERWRRVGEGSGADTAAGKVAREEMLREFAAGMHEDLNVAQAMAAINSWVSACGSPSREDAEAMKLVDGVLGVLELVPKAVTSEIAAYAPGVAPDAKVEELLTARKDARAKKDFAASDRIRDELAAMGYAIKDMAGGRVEVRRA